MSQRNRSTRSQRDLNRSPRPSTSQRRRRDSSSDYSELHDLSLQTQDELRENEKKMYVLAVSKYILAMTKKKLPMKCNELVKHCMHGEHRLFSEIFPLVSNQLADLYGLEAHDFRDEKLGKIILCTSSVTTSTELEFTVQQRTDMQLLFIVLSYIQMKGETVAEATLFSFLKRLGLQDEPHDRFGHFKKKITETFIRQLYLKRETIQIEGSNTDDRIQYTWGQRAQYELSKEKVTEAVAKIFQVSPSVFLGKNGESNEENGEPLETSDIEMNGD